MSIKGQIGCKIYIKGQEASVLFLTGPDRIQAIHEDPGGTAAQISLKKRRHNIKQPCHKILTMATVTMADIRMSFA